MMKRAGYRIGIVNPLTLEGQEIKSILHQRGIAYTSISLIDTTGESRGVLTEVDETAAVVTEASAEQFEGLDLVFFCGPPAANEPWIHQDGFLAIDLSQPASSEGLPIVAGINSEVMSEATRLLVSPHPIATSLTLILDRIEQLSAVTICAATVVQPASELGQQGVDEMFQQTVAVLNVQSIPKKVFDRQAAFNLYPAVNAKSVEEYAENQIGLVMRRSMPVTITLTQGTLFHSHAFSAFIQTEKELSRAEIMKALESTTAIAVGGDDDSISTVDAAGRDEILVGRVEPARATSGFWIWAAADNLRRSSALNAVMIAEEWIARFGATVH